MQFIDAYTLMSIPYREHQVHSLAERLHQNLNCKMYLLDRKNINHFCLLVRNKWNSGDKHKPFIYDRL